MSSYDLLRQVGPLTLLGSLLLALLWVLLRLAALPLALGALVLDGLADLTHDQLLKTPAARPDARSAAWHHMTTTATSSERRTAT